MKAIIFFADGCEEVEALTVYDGLLRAGFEVTKAAVGGKKTIKSSHNVEITCEALVEDCTNEDYDLAYAPGGMPGSANLAQCWAVNEILIKCAQDKVVAAICAAPAVVLGPLGLLNGKKCTCFPGCEEYSPSIEFNGEGVVVDGNIVTAKSVAWAWPLAFTLISLLMGDEKRAEIEKAVCWKA